MGIFKFANDKGEKIAKASEKNSQQAAVDYLSSLGLPVDGIAVEMATEDTVKVSGSLQNQEEREKVVLALGNIFGVAEVEDDVEVAGEMPQATFYTVQPGDTLSKIAKEHYGNAMEYPAIFEANKPMLKDPDKIYVGQTLRIPSK